MKKEEKKPVDTLAEEALEYHSRPPRGKVEVRATKPTSTQHDLVLAYSPGVAAPCLEIARDESLSWKYTARGNLVAVVSDGSAVLGLGNIGPLASKPVMEGKAVLFKQFAGIDVFDLEIDSKDPNKFIDIVSALEPTFGGINLEDIKAPECFKIEPSLQKKVGIPVFHDDQHGTAIISGAALINALALIGKSMESVKVVFSGAGAAAIGCANFYLQLGMRRDNISMADSKGVLHQDRDDISPQARQFAQKTKCRILKEIVRDADIFVGLSAPNVLTPEMLKSMAKKPIVFALANPTPEIDYHLAKKTRPDSIIATGRSDYPNQVNNVLCFPFIFRGALDVRATCINEEMKLAASNALALLARAETPDEVLDAYNLNSLHFGKEYLIPKPFDHRVLLSVAPAVARAAIETGVAAASGNFKYNEYRDYLESLQSLARYTVRKLNRRIKVSAHSRKKRVVFPDSSNESVLRACSHIVQEGVATPVLLGSPKHIEKWACNWQIDLHGVEIIDPLNSPLVDKFADELLKIRARKGIDKLQAQAQASDVIEFGLMMVRTNQADCFVGGISRPFPSILRPSLKIIGVRKEACTVSGFYMLIYKDRVLFLSDCVVNIKPDAEKLAYTAINTARAARFLGHTPKVAFVSFCNFGSSQNEEPETIQAALKIVHQKEPSLMAEGEMQAHLALSHRERQKLFPFSVMEGSANILIMPNLSAASIACCSLVALSDADIVGPILSGMKKPVNLIPQEARVQDIISMTTISVLEAQEQVL